MKKILIFSIIIIATILQTSVFPLYFSDKTVPDIVLVLSIAAIAVFGFPSMWKVVLLAGFIVDLFSFSRIGVHVTSFIIFSYCTSFFSRRLIIGDKASGLLLGAALIAAMTFFQALWEVFADTGFGFSHLLNMGGIRAEDIGWKILFNISLFFICILVLKHIHKKTVPPNPLLVQQHVWK